MLLIQGLTLVLLFFHSNVTQKRSQKTGERSSTEYLLHGITLQLCIETTRLKLYLNSVLLGVTKQL